VAFLALMLNTRRDDYDPPADERRAQADEGEKEKLACRLHSQQAFATTAALPSLRLGR
jgi:hypothetical protein